MADAEVERVFVFADLSGYTALTEAHGAAGAARTIGRYLELVTAALAPGARVLERVGDEVVVVGDDAGAAVATALALRDAVEREADFPTVRVGIHRGVVLERGGAYFGAALNLAARVAAQARAGQILCTQAVADAIGGAACRPLGTMRFRNVAAPVGVWEVLGRHAGEGRAIDPVCRMQVDPDTAAGRLTWKGAAHHFCSLDCARVFAGDPGAYAG